MSKDFDGAIFLLVGLIVVLDVMIEGEDELFGIVNLLRANAFKLAHHRRSVVMGHDV